MIPRVHRKQEIYSGPYLDDAPDLLIDSWLDRAFLPSQSAGKHGGRPVVTSGRPPRKSLGEKTASHRYNGILLLKGKPFKAGQALEGAQIIELAPTILHLMDVPVPDDMDGQVLTEALKDEYLIRHPVAYRTEDGVDGKRSGQL